MDIFMSAVSTMFCFVVGMFTTNYIFQMMDKRDEERAERRRAFENVRSRYRSPDIEITKTYDEAVKGLEKLRELNRERMQIMHDQIMSDIENLKKNIDRDRAQTVEQQSS